MANKTVGIVGGGQLGRMLAQAARSLGVRTIILENTKDCPAAEIADEQVLGSFKDADKIRGLAEKCDVITFEIESANSEILKQLEAEGKIIHPSPHTLEIIKNKFSQKQFLRDSGIAVADFIEVKTREDILAAAHNFDYPIVLKAKFDAYDGRGNALIESEDDIDQAMQKLNGRELYVEKFVVFEKELAVVAARAVGGTIATFPVVETIHKNNICHIVKAPAQISDGAKDKARDFAISALSHLKGVGVFAVELFLTTESQVMVNEIAPRVHNSGHLTIEACQTSQFEQHIRAVTAMNLGPTDLKTPVAVMVNILGERDGGALINSFDGTWDDFRKKNSLPDIQTAGAVEIFVHIYGKLQTKMERKMGHITVLADDMQTAEAAGKDIRKLIDI